MITDQILSSLSNGVLTISMNRREKKNALTSFMYETMAELLNSSAENSDVLCVVIRGQEDLFTSGNDVKDFLNRNSTEIPPAIHFLRAISSYPKPIIAAVGGQAIGIGTTMLMHCDLVISATNATFQLPFVNLGLCPEAASSYLFPKMAGSKLANQLLLLGETFNALLAKEAGIVNYITDDSLLLNKANELAQKITSQPPEAIISTKRLLKCNDQELVRQSMDKEFSEFSRLLNTKACKEIFTAFLEKRPVNKSLVFGR